jgi:hypothetical protein
MGPVELELSSILSNDIGFEFDILSLPFADMENVRQLAILLDRVQMVLLNSDRILGTESGTLPALYTKFRQLSSKGMNGMLSYHDRKCCEILAR